MNYLEKQEFSKLINTRTDIRGGFVNLLKKSIYFLYPYDKDYIFIKGSMDEMRKDSSKTIVWSLDHSWNSVEFGLPGLYYLKQKHEVRLIFFAGDAGIWNKCQEEHFIFDIIKRIFDVVIVNSKPVRQKSWVKRKIQRLKKSLFEYNTYRYFFRDVNVDILLELNNPIRVKEYFYNEHPETLHVCHQHSTFQKSIYYPDEEYLPLPKVDYMLCTDDYLLQIVGKEDAKKIAVIGAPQLDKWWRDLSGRNELAKLKMKLHSDRKTIVVLLPCLEGNERLFPEDYESLHRVLNDNAENVNIILKFHPRDILETRERFVSAIKDGNDVNNVISTTVITECLSELADCVIVAGATSAAAGAIINDVPVIEFHANKPMTLLYEKDGRYGTYFRIMNLILYAENYSQLKQAVHGVLYEGLWKKYKGKYKGYMLNDNCSSKRFAEILINLL